MGMMPLTTIPPGVMAPAYRSSQSPTLHEGEIGPDVPGGTGGGGGGGGGGFVLRAPADTNVKFTTPRVETPADEVVVMPGDVVEVHVYYL